MQILLCLKLWRPKVPPKLRFIFNRARILPNYFPVPGIKAGFTAQSRK